MGWRSFTNLLIDHYKQTENAAYKTMGRYGIRTGKPYICRVFTLQYVWH